MSNSNGAVQCPHCREYFLNNSNLVCPFCGKTLIELPDIFKEFFGNTNNQGENDNEAY